jgi:hypothetical protein
MNETQIRTVREWLEAGNTITSYEAFIKWKITRLSAVIHTLIHTYGVRISGEMELNNTTNKRYKRYKLL